MNPQYQKISSAHNRTIVVGDVHGCFAELMNLLSAIQFTDDDLLISVGDLVDRGPYTFEVIRFFNETPNAYSVLGNHERRLAGTIRGTVEPAWSQLHTLSKLPQNEHSLWAEFLDNLPVIIETRHAIITHARLDPTVSIKEQDAYHACAVGGAGVTIDLDINGIPLWFTKWKERFNNDKPICIGHTAYKNIELVPLQLFALDTKAVKGGFLTAVILPECKIFQTKSEKNYYEESRIEWSMIELGKYKPEELPIYKYFRIKNKKNKNLYEKKAFDAFEGYLYGLKINEILEKLKQRLMDYCGDLPPPGPARWNYFLSIKEKMPFANHRLIHMILSSKQFSIHTFLRLFEGSDLTTALAEIYRIQIELKAYSEPDD